MCLSLTFVIPILVEVEGYTVPHFKAPVYVKMELWGLECGGTFSIQTSLLNVSNLIHKTGFVPIEVGTTVHKRSIFFEGYNNSAHTFILFWHEEMFKFMATNVIRNEFLTYTLFQFLIYYK